MFRVCAGLLLVELGAAAPISHVNAVSVEKAKAVDSLNTNLVALWGLGFVEMHHLRAKKGGSFVMSHLQCFYGTSHASC